LGKHKWFVCGSVEIQIFAANLLLAFTFVDASDWPESHLSSENFLVRKRVGVGQETWSMHA
jgi:hypothetical protein